MRSDNNNVPQAAATEHPARDVDIVVVIASQKKKSNKSGCTTSTFAKIRQTAVENVRSRALRHALVYGHLHPPTPIVATGVATSLYRDYVHATWTARTDDNGEEEDDGEWEDALEQTTLPTQATSCLVLSSAAGTGKTCAGIMLVNGRSSYAPHKSLYVGGVTSSNGVAPTPSSWYDSVRRGILQTNDVHDAMDDFQLAKLLGEVFKLETTKNEKDQKNPPPPSSSGCNVLCQSEEVSLIHHGSLINDDDKLVPYMGLEHKITGLHHKSNSNVRNNNGVLVLDDMNFDLDTSEDHAPFQHQLGSVYTFCRSLAEIAAAREFLVVFITHRPLVAAVLESLPGVRAAPASQFAWTPRRRLRLLAKRFSPSIGMKTLRAYAKDETVGMEEVCATLGKVQLRANLPALACASTGSM